MRDDFFQSLIDNLGEPDSRREVPGSSSEKYRSILPEALLGYWRNAGWRSFADGLFWVVVPEPYKTTLDRWLQGSGLAEIDSYHVIARDAFGSLYAWGERHQRKITISSLAGGIVALKNQLRKANPHPDRTLGIFLGSYNRESLDFEDNQGKPLFQRALKKLGPVGEDEMYAFEPALCIGGRADLEHMVKVDIHAHLMILDQLRR
ncbi:GAD-like domain-containing protein [Pseudomonas syringae]|uniref:GAD-like domain-containing protein n=1 Tax=Pseudomonas syringae TaxID=317 RepID=UPI001F2D702F|nr:GAD-like domain-containing protein [Pseudomonas syringae]